MNIQTLTPHPRSAPPLCQHSHTLALHSCLSWVQPKLQQASDKLFSSDFFLVSPAALLVCYISGFGMSDSIFLSISFRFSRVIGGDDFRSTHQPFRANSNEDALSKICARKNTQGSL